MSMHGSPTNQTVYGPSEMLLWWNMKNTGGGSACDDINHSIIALRFEELTCDWPLMHQNSLPIYFQNVNCCTVVSPSNSNCNITMTNCCDVVSGQIDVANRDVFIFSPSPVLSSLGRFCRPYNNYKYLLANWQNGSYTWCLIQIHQAVNGPHPIVFWYLYTKAHFKTYTIVKKFNCTRIVNKKGRLTLRLSE